MINQAPRKAKKTPRSSDPIAIPAPPPAVNTFVLFFAGEVLIGLRTAVAFVKVALEKVSVALCDGYGVATAFVEVTPKPGVEEIAVGFVLFTMLVVGGVFCDVAEVAGVGVFVEGESGTE